jgi:Uma2 family endonuclease
MLHARPRRLTRAEYHRLGELGVLREDERVELIRGMLVEMAPIGPGHADVVDVLTEVFVTRLVGRAKVRIQQPLVAWDESEPEPDVALVPPGRYARAHPSEAFLVVEVADSSLDYDTETKAPLYAQSGFEEYWIVDVEARAVIVHTRPTAKGYGKIDRVAVGAVLAPARFPDVAIPVAALFP